jgi:DNA-binding response OmpR family regulator
MPKKVLIIEDSGDIGMALKLLIEFEGYEAIVASSATTGRDLALELRPDLIIMDIRLPDEDGIVLTRSLRASPETKDTPIVCVSSYTRGLETEALIAGCNEVFSKVTFMESFNQTLTKYLGGA